MPRVIGIDIPDNKRLEVALTYIYGSAESYQIRSLRNWDSIKDMRAQQLNEDEIARIQRHSPIGIYRGRGFATSDPE